jgi:hypothetical protein
VAPQSGRGASSHGSPCAWLAQVSFCEAHHAREPHAPACTHLAQHLGLHAHHDVLDLLVQLLHQNTQALALRYLVQGGGGLLLDLGQVAGAAVLGPVVAGGAAVLCVAAGADDVDVLAQAVLEDLVELGLLALLGNDQPPTGETGRGEGGEMCGRRWCR